MADQTVRIEGTPGSKENVALELMKFILNNLDIEKPKGKDNALTFYADCLRVVKGGRPS